MPTERKIVLGLFAIALGLRVLYGAVFTTQTELATQPLQSDFNYAKEIAGGLGWITEPYSPRSPGYPIVLATLYLLSAKQMWLVAFFHAVLGALTVVVVYRLGRYLLDVPFATVAALWFAFHARHIHFSYVFQRDILAVLLIMVVLFLIVRPFVKMRYAFLSAAAYAALIHVDPQYLLFLPVLAVFVLFKTRHRLLNIQYLFVFFGIVLIASVPWTIRNYAIYGQPLPIGPEARRFLRPVKLVVTEPEMGLSEIESKIVKASRVRLIERNTVEFWRVARFRGQPVSEGNEPTDPLRRGFADSAWSARHNVANIVNYGVMLPFFLVGIVCAARSRNRIAIMLSTVTVVYFLMRAYLGGNERTRLPIEALIILVAFYGIAEIFQRVQRERSSPEAQE